MAEPVDAAELVLSSEDGSDQDSREAIGVGPYGSPPTAGAVEPGVTRAASSEAARATLEGSEPTVARKSSVIDVPPLSSARTETNGTRAGVARKAGRIK
jgi:hypothetical protein